MLHWIKNASVGMKVSFAPISGVICLALMGAIGWFANHQLSGALGTLTESRMPRIAQVSDLKMRLAELNAAVNQSLAWEGAGFKADKIAALDKRIGGDLTRYAADVKAMAGAAADATDKAQWQQLGAEFDKYNKATLDTLDIKSGMLANAASYLSVIDGSYARLSAAFAQISTREAASSSAVSREAHDLARANTRMIASSFVLAVLFCAGFAWLASRLIVTPLQEAARLAHAMAGGDFTARASHAPTSDATGQVLTAMADVSLRLGKVVHDIRGSAEQVNVASQEIAQGNADLSQRTENTASALEQTAASLEELTATVRSSAQSAGQANTLARAATQIADQGGQAMSEVVSTMERIDAQAKKIRDIIGVIDGIAFQTNILALNAAVEAARAGEQGRGFSVVAQEVRTLAQRSAESAKEIRQLIGNSVEQADRGAKLVQSAGQTMQRVVESIRKVGVTIEEISRAANEQASGIAQVNAAISEMDRNTQQNAAMVEQASAAAQTLKAQAHRLAESVGTLRTESAASHEPMLAR